MKIPKYYHTDFTKSARQSSSSQSDPLLDVGEIKSEPIDYEENSSAVEYNNQQDQYVEHSTASKPLNPIIDPNSSPVVPKEMKFKKIKLTKPVIMEVHTVEEPSASSGGIEVIKIKLQKSRKASDISSNMGNTTIVSTEDAMADETVNKEGLLLKSSALHESEIGELATDEASQIEDGEEPPPALSKENTMGASPIEEVYKYSVEGPPTLAKEVGLCDSIGVDDTFQTGASAQAMIDDTSEDEDDRPLVEYIPTLYNSVEEDIEEPKINTLRIHEVYSESDNVASSTQEEMTYNSINEDEDSDRNCQIQIIETHSVSQEAEEMQCDEQIMTTALEHLKNEVISTVDTINTDVPPDIE